MGIYAPSIVVGLLLAAWAWAANRWLHRERVRSDWTALAAMCMAAAALAIVVLPPGEWRLATRVEMAADLAMISHFVAAGWALLLGVTLQVESGLLVRQRTTRFARGILLAVGAGVVLYGGPEPWLLVPALLAALAWIARFNRHGGGRHAHARATSAGLLVASAVQLALSVAHYGHDAWIDGRAALHTLPADLLPTAVGLVALVAGLRFLSGGVAAGPVVLSVATGVTLLGPIGHALQRPVPPEGTELARWIDLDGRRGPPIPHQLELHCVDFASESSGCSLPDLALPGSTPLDQIVTGRDLIVDARGLRRVPTWSARSWIFREPVHDGVVRRSANGFAVEVRGATHQVATLAEAVRLVTGTLTVVATPDLTLQDFVSACASTGPLPACVLSR
jgi:hypothetical protein